MLPRYQPCYFIFLFLFHFINTNCQIRDLRYFPDNTDFTTSNSKIKFNRALYGGNSGFRVETGDVPEFAFYLPGMGGNIQLAIEKNKKIKWINDFELIESRFSPGKKTYFLKDSILNNGSLTLIALATFDKEGLILQLTTQDIPSGIKLYIIYGGGTAKKFSRSGDLNADPPDCFELKPSYCKDNKYYIKKNSFKVSFGAHTKYGIKEITGVFPKQTKLYITDYYALNNLSSGIHRNKSDSLPVLISKTTLSSHFNSYFYFEHTTLNDFDSNRKLKNIYFENEKERIKLNNHVQIKTPDPYVNTLGPILSSTSDAIWDGKSYQHGAVGWRKPLPGWRGAYASDVLGWHNRAKKHFSSYAQSQVLFPKTGPMIMDTSRHLARGLEKMGTSLFSEGYICRNPGENNKPHHYDMNLVFIDALLWHLQWTGDTAYAREMWPLIKRHLQWEKRNFDPDNDGLYDAYACIWASDALQYSSGNVTHSSAYNYRANVIAAEIASFLKKDASPYINEANKILKAINSRLWLPNKGCWAEYEEFFEKKQLHTSAAIWTIYHAIDANIGTPFMTYQSLRYIDQDIPHIPLNAKGFEKDSLELISTTNWMPYSWSINNVAYAEILHTSLAYWQGNRNNQAFNLWKAGMLDAMYLGSSPGNVVQISHYDAARGETYRDFADPVGMLARSTIQGLFGILPDALNQELLIKPGLPDDWDSAYFNSPDIEFSFKRLNNTETYEINLKQLEGNNLTIEIPVLSNTINKILLNNTAVRWENIETAVGCPKIRINCGTEKKYTLKITWEGDKIPKVKKIALVKNASFKWNFTEKIIEVYDPQSLFTNTQKEKNQFSGIITDKTGHRTAFIKLQSGDFSYWLPLHIDIIDPLEIIPINPEENYLSFVIKNNLNEDVKLKVNTAYNWNTSINIKRKNISDTIIVPKQNSAIGTNTLFITNITTQQTYNLRLINWSIQLDHLPKQTHLMINPIYNAKISDIFKNKYLSPRSPYVTLQIPWQGIGEWCHPYLSAKINETGIIKRAKDSGFYSLPNNISFALPQDTVQQNIAYTSLWDNYPDSLEFPVNQKASHAYFLMAGSTNHMQSHFINGTIRAYYSDGTYDKLQLINPDNWPPIEQDYFDDGLAFRLNQPRPWRIQLSTGKAFRDASDCLGIKGVGQRNIEGGAATVLDMTLNRNKEIKHFTLKTTAYEVVIGVCAITLIK